MKLDTIACKTMTIIFRLLHMKNPALVLASWVLSNIFVFLSVFFTVSQLTTFCILLHWNRVFAVCLRGSVECIRLLCNTFRIQSTCCAWYFIALKSHSHFLHKSYVSCICCAERFDASQSTFFFILLHYLHYKLTMQFIELYPRLKMEVTCWKVILSFHHFIER